MIGTVIDGKFDKRYLYNLFSVIEGIGYTADNVANRKTWPFGEKGTHRLMGTQIFNRRSVNRITELHPSSSNFFDLFEQIERILGKQYYLNHIDVNLQHSGNDGTLHKDTRSCTHTIMFYPNPEWKKEWGGEFQIFSKDGKEVLEEYEYIPGRIILFECNHPHRGLGPKKEYPDVYRYSIAFRGTPMQSQNDTGMQDYMKSITGR